MTKGDAWNERSCVGCKFLYGQGTGYSNYTWLDTEIRCARGANENLPADKPSDWLPTPAELDQGGGRANRDWDLTDQERMDTGFDNWPKTNCSRCALYSPGPYVELDIDCENYPSEFTDDWEAIEAVCNHAGRASSKEAHDMLDLLKAR